MFIFSWFNLRNSPCSSVDSSICGSHWWPYGDTLSYVTLFKLDLYATHYLLVDISSQYFQVYTCKCVFPWLVIPNFIAVFLVFESVEPFRAQPGDPWWLQRSGCQHFQVRSLRCPISGFQQRSFLGKTISVQIIVIFLFNILYHWHTNIGSSLGSRIAEFFNR